MASKAALLRAAKSGGSAAVKKLVAGEAAVVASVEVGQSYRVRDLYSGKVSVRRVEQINFLGKSHLVLLEGGMMYDAKYLVASARIS